MKKLLKKDMAFSALFMLVILLLVIFVATNLLYTHQINNILSNWYIDKASSNTSVYFQKILNIEDELNKLTYDMFNSSSALSMSLNSPDNSKSLSNHASIFIGEKLIQNNLDAIIICRQKDNKIIDTAYRLKTHTNDSIFYDIISHVSEENKWSFTEINGDGYLVYMTRDFSGYNAVYLLSANYLSGRFYNSQEANENDLIVYYDDSYLFNYSGIISNSFTSTDIDKFKFTDSSKFYKDSSYIYIMNTNYRFSIVSIYDINSFTEWKSSVTRKITALFFIAIFAFAVILFYAYITSRKKIISFNNLMKTHGESNCAAGIIKNTYSGIEINQASMDSFKNEFSEYVSFAGVMLGIDNFNRSEDESDISNILKILYVDTVDAFSKKYRTESAVCSDDTISLLIASKETILQDSITDILNTVLKKFIKQTNHTFTSFISDEFCNCEDIGKNLLTLNELKPYRFIYGYNSVITTEYAVADYSIEYPQRIEDNFIDAIIQSDRANAMKYSSDFFTVLIQMNHPTLAKEWISSFCFSALRKTQFLYKNADYGFHFIKKIFESETMDECVLILQEMLPNIELIKPISMAPDSAHFSRKVNEIIKNEYSNQNLNIAYIASKMNMTSTYLGQKFAKDFNTSFNAYLANYRINKSMELLASTNEKISDIAVECGFSSGTYFTKLFREYTGMTPSQYRNSLHTS